MQALPLVLMAGGSILKGISSFKAGKVNRGIANANAHTALLEGTEQATRIRQAARMQLGRQFGAQAESGFMVNQGSALDSLAESATNGELAAMDALRQAQSRAAAYRQQGASAFAEGKSGLISGLFGAASAVAGGINDYARAGADYANAGAQYGYGS
jgi:hypothetical protein